MKLFPIAVVVLVAGCATYQPVAPDFPGSVALLSDSQRLLGGNRSQLFVAEAIDGKAIANSIGVIAAQGFGSSPRIVQRKVPIAPMKVRLHATDLPGASIQSLTTRAAATTLDVQGTVDFSPEADKEYAVTGDLKSGDSAVWIEDTATHLPVTSRIVAN